MDGLDATDTTQNTTQDDLKKLSPSGVSAMQGDDYSDTNPSKEGSDFEHLMNNDVFKGSGIKRIVVHAEDNPHLEKINDIGLTKSRRITDAYWKEDGSVWEFKHGYEKGKIDDDQLEDLSLMEKAGYVYANENGKKVKLPVTSINYVFATKAGAEHNADGRATFWYLDENKELQLLE